MSDLLNMMRDGVTAALKNRDAKHIKIGCNVHPKYEAKRAPRCNCSICWRIWYSSPRGKASREEEPESRLVAHVEALNGLCEKFTSPGRRDVPDRIVTEGYGWDRAAHLLHDLLKQHAYGASLLLTHAGRKVAVRDIVAQMIYLVECKAPGKKPNKRQKLDHERRRKLGITVRVYDGEWKE